MEGAQCQQAARRSVAGSAAAAAASAKGVGQGMQLLLRLQLLSAAHGDAQQPPPHHGSQRHRHSIADLPVAGAS